MILLILVSVLIFFSPATCLGYLGMALLLCDHREVLGVPVVVSERSFFSLCLCCRRWCYRITLFFIFWFSSCFYLLQYLFYVLFYGVSLRYGCRTFRLMLVSVCVACSCVSCPVLSYFTHRPCAPLPSHLRVCGGFEDLFEMIAAKSDASIAGMCQSSRTAKQSTN